MVHFIKISIFIFLLTFTSLASAQTGNMGQLVSYFQKAANFDYEYPREKVYLHLDNNGYYEDETIYFKAYVMRASALTATTLSRVLYVELLKDDGSILQRKLLPVDSVGQAHGDFKLELPVVAGFHEIRAYTREMTNWGEEACFSRVFPVFTKPKKKRSSDMSLEDINPDDLLIPKPDNRKLNEHLADYHAHETRLDFFPEGGNRVEGVEQRIAFKLTDGRGADLSDTICIYDETGSLLTTARVEHAGMGRFTLPPDFRSGYAEVRGKQFQLPASEKEQKYALMAEDNGDSLLIRISPAAGTRNRLLGVAIHCRDRMCYLDTLTIGASPVERNISTKILRDGVNRVEIVNTEGKSLCKRLVWKSIPPMRNLDLNIRQSKMAYDKFSPVALDISLKDAQGRPVSTTFSLSVRDNAGELVRADAPTCCADILLSSELKGYIHQPDFYFAKDDAARRHALDLLLMVQGWSANTFETLCGKTPFLLQQPIEENLTLNGHVYKYESDELKPYPNLKMMVKMYSRKGAALKAEATTDREGRFAFVSNVDYIGDWIATITTLDEEGNKKWARIAFDRWFIPKKRKMNYKETQLEAPTPRVYDKDDKPGNKDIFVWKDTLTDKNSILLGTATIKAKKKYKGFTGNRYTYNGGEKAGMRMANQFYNVEIEVERYKDSGKIPGNILNFFSYLCSEAEVHEETIPAEDVQTEPESNIQQTDNEEFDFRGNKTEGENGISSESLKYKGEKPMILVNNGISRIPLENLLAEEVKSISVIEGAGKISHLTPPSFEVMSGNGLHSPTNRANHAIIIYELPDAYLYRSANGVEKRRVWGYATPSKFYQPEYNNFDIPSPKDIRRTLYWNPSVKTDKNGKASVIFYTNCREDVELRISAHGITANGQMIDMDK